MKTKLSPYTIASNCTDLTDIRDGINEIQEEMKRLVSEGKNVPSFFYSRLSKLQTKRKKFEQKNQIHMNVTIRFFIDEETLTMAVRHCLYFQIEPSFPNVKKAIRNYCCPIKSIAYKKSCSAIVYSMAESCFVILSPCQKIDS